MADPTEGDGSADRPGALSDPPRPSRRSRFGQAVVIAVVGALLVLIIVAHLLGGFRGIH